MLAVEPEPEAEPEPPDEKEREGGATASKTDDSVLVSVRGGRP